MKDLKGGIAMAKNLYVTAAEAGSGKSTLILGIMYLLLKNVRNVAFFRPIIPDPAKPTSRDHNINLVLSHFNLDLPYEDTFAYTFNEARQTISQGNHALLLDNILHKYKQLESRYDFVLCEGSDFIALDSAFEFDLNADIAANLGAPVIVVASAKDKTCPEILASTQTTLDLLNDTGLNIIACLVNRAVLTEKEKEDLLASLL
ncbi:MAG: AAA family ATPase, partial [Deltaproteobacteria bacterium]|nr:AAA family ATPase [Deltaproteobacteria bacterium]